MFWGLRLPVALETAAILEEGDPSGERAQRARQKRDEEQAAAQELARLRTTLHEQQCDDFCVPASQSPQRF